MIQTKCLKKKKTKIDKLKNIHNSHSNNDVRVSNVRKHVHEKGKKISMLKVILDLEKFFLQYSGRYRERKNTFFTLFLISKLNLIDGFKNATMSHRNI